MAEKVLASVPQISTGGSKDIFAGTTSVGMLDLMTSAVEGFNDSWRGISQQ